MERKCLDCGDILSGRSDQKFCSDYCRNSYNNKLNRDETNYMKNVHNILRRNRRILTEFNSDRRLKVHKDDLIVKGYNFNFHTNTFTTKAGKTYYFCYEHGYLSLNDDYFELVLKEDYIPSTDVFSFPNSLSK